MPVAGAAFLGCTFADGVAAEVEAAGGLLLPAVSGTPVDVGRTSLYTPAELYDDAAYPRCLDARAYAWAERPADPDATWRGRCTTTRSTRPSVRGRPTGTWSA